MYRVQRTRGGALYTDTRRLWFVPDQATPPLGFITSDVERIGKGVFYFSVAVAIIAGSYLTYRVADALFAD